METRPDTGPPASGYVIVLLGGVGFVVGCFLPFLSPSLSGAITGEDSVSLIRLFWTPAEGLLDHLGAVLNLFAGAATAGVVALLGVGRQRGWTPNALIAGVAAWTLTWIGVLLNQAGFGHGVGYWVLLASMSVAIVGTVVFWVSARAHAREPTTGASSIEVEGTTTRDQPPPPPP